jgi:Pyridine nucleotide-disulphide oxidoreductase
VAPELPAFSMSREFSVLRAGMWSSAPAVGCAPTSLCVPQTCRYIGLEMGSVWGRLGAQVTVVEFLDRIVPTMVRRT